MSVMIAHAPSIDLPPVSTDHGQRRLSQIAKRAWANNPEAVALEEDLVRTVAHHIKGERDLHKGPRSEDAWDDVLELKRRMHLGDITRLAMSNRPKAKAAVRAVIAHLDIRSSGTSAQDERVMAVMSKLANDATAIVTYVEQALSDGFFSDAKRAAVIELLHAHRSKVEHAGSVVLVAPKIAAWKAGK